MYQHFRICSRAVVNLKFIMTFQAICLRVFLFLISFQMADVNNTSTDNKCTIELLHQTCISANTDVTIRCTCPSFSQCSLYKNGTSVGTGGNAVAVSPTQVDYTLSFAANEDGVEIQCRFFPVDGGQYIFSEKITVTVSETLQCSASVPSSMPPYDSTSPSSELPKTEHSSTTRLLSTAVPTSSVTGGGEHSIAVLACIIGVLSVCVHLGILDICIYCERQQRKLENSIRRAFSEISGDSASAEPPQQGYFEEVMVVLLSQPIEEEPSETECQPGKSEPVEVVVSKTLSPQNATGYVPSAAGDELHQRSKESTQLNTQQPDVKHLVDVIRELGHFVHTIQLGLNLGLSPECLQVIEMDHASTSEQLREILLTWLKRNFDPEKYGLPSWSALANTVDPIDHALALTIKKNHHLS